MVSHADLTWDGGAAWRWSSAAGPRPLHAGVRGGATGCRSRSPASPRAPWTSSATSANSGARPNYPPSPQRPSRPPRSPPRRARRSHPRATPFASPSAPLAGPPAAPPAPPRTVRRSASTKKRSKRASPPPHPNRRQQRPRRRRRCCSSAAPRAPPLRRRGAGRTVPEDTVRTSAGRTNSEDRRPPAPPSPSPAPLPPLAHLPARSPSPATTPASPHHRPPLRLQLSRRQPARLGRPRRRRISSTTDSIAGRAHGRLLERHCRPRRRRPGVPHRGPMSASAAEVARALAAYSTVPDAAAAPFRREPPHAAARSPSPRPPPQPTRRPPLRHRPRSPNRAPGRGPRSNPSRPPTRRPRPPSRPHPPRPPRPNPRHPPARPNRPRRRRPRPNLSRRRTPGAVGVRARCARARALMFLEQSEYGGLITHLFAIRTLLPTAFVGLNGEVPGKLAAEREALRRRRRPALHQDADAAVRADLGRTISKTALVALGAARARPRAPKTRSPPRRSIPGEGDRRPRRPRRRRPRLAPYLARLENRSARHRDALADPRRIAALVRSSRPRGGRVDERVPQRADHDVHQRRRAAAGMSSTACCRGTQNAALDAGLRNVRTALRDALEAAAAQSVTRCWALSVSARRRACRPRHPVLR